MVLARVVGGEHAIDERAIELDIDEAVDRAVLQHLEAADRLAELLAQLDVVERHIERGGGEADELDRRAEHQELLQLQCQPARLRPGRDHVLGRNVDLREGKPARRRSVDIAFGRDRHVCCAGRRPARAALRNRSQRETRPPIRHRRRTECCHRARRLCGRSGCRTRGHRAARMPPRSRARSGRCRPARRRALPTRATCPRPATSSTQPRRSRAAGPATAAGRPAPTQARDRRRRGPPRRDLPQRQSPAIARRAQPARRRGPGPRRPPATRAGAWARRDRRTAAQRSRRTGFAARSATSPRQFSGRSHQLGSPSTRLAMMLRWISTAPLPTVTRRISNISAAGLTT